MLRIEISKIFLIIKTLELKTNGGSFIHMNMQKNLIQVLIKESLIKEDLLIYDTNPFTHKLLKN